MCFDAKSSLEAFIISSVGISMLYFSGDKIKQKISFFWLSIALIQLWEYFIWKNINNKEKNIFWSNILRLNIILQPLIALILLNSLPSYLPKIVFITLLIIYSVYLIKLFYKIYKNGKEETKISQNNNLRWPTIYFSWTSVLNMIPGTIYMIALVILPWFIKPLRTGLIFGLLIVFSFLLLFLKTKHYNILKEETFRSLWCYFSSSLPLIQAIIM